MVSRTIKRPRKFASYRGKQKKGLQEGYPDKSPDDEVKKKQNNGLFRIIRFKAQYI